MTPPTGRPFVYINMAMTVDGKITSATREYPKFSSSQDRIRMDRLRAGADALMVAAGTIRADNPTFHVRTREVRESAGNRVLHRVAISGSARIPADSRFFDATHGGDSILVTTEAVPESTLAPLEDRVEVWRYGRESVDLHATLAALHERGIERLLVEGGGELNWSLLRSDLVDELNVTIAPALLGGGDAPTLLGGQGWPMREQRRLRLLELERHEDELYCRYAIVRPGP